jgi:hypothetical protein
LHVATQAPAKVVQRAQIKIAYAQLPISKCLTHLHIIAKLIIHLFVAPTVACLQILQSN